MITHLRHNSLLVGLIIVNLLYSVVGSMAPKPFAFNVVAIMATIAGFYGVLVYSKKTWEVLWHKRRAEAGAHLKIVGVWHLAFAALYAGLWRGAWISLGSPPNWLMTWHSSYGWVFVMIGMFLVTISPAAMEEGTPLPRAFWIVLGGAILFVTGVVAGSYLT